MGHPATIIIGIGQQLAVVAILWFLAQMKPLVFDRALAGQIFSINRRIRKGWKAGRAQPDSNPDKRRASDTNGPWPRFPSN